MQNYLITCATRVAQRRLASATCRVSLKRKRCLIYSTDKIGFNRNFSISATRFAEGEYSRNVADSDESSLQPFLTHNHGVDPTEYLTPSSLITVQDLGPEERADYDLLSKSDQEKYLALQNHYKAVLEAPATDQEMNRLVDQVYRETSREHEGFDFDMSRTPRSKIGYWAEDEDDEFGQMEDGDDVAQEEDITTVAEDELQLHREVREYTRVIAWDMPLLQKFAKPFQVPTHKTPLRFRYTTYLGEHHPAAKKVVVEFCTKDLQGLSEEERIKLVKLAGVRYNSENDVIRLSCERFETPAQNKRYLGDTVQKLIATAKDHSEMFEDVAVDNRHQKHKTRPTFPEEWKLRTERVQALHNIRNGDQGLLPEPDRSVQSPEKEYVYADALGKKPSPILPNLK